MTGVQIVTGEPIQEQFNFDEDSTNNLTKDVDKNKIDKTDETKRSESMAKSSGKKKAAATGSEEAVENEDVTKNEDSTEDSTQETEEETDGNTSEDTSSDEGTEEEGSEETVEKSEDTSETEETQETEEDTSKEEDSDGTEDASKNLHNDKKKKKPAAKATKKDSESTEEEPEEETEGDTEDTEKGLVQDNIERLMQNKFVKLRKVFDTIRAFDEAVFDSSADSEDLKEVVKEFATIISSEADLIKSIQVDEIAEVIMKKFDTKMDDLKKSLGVKEETKEEEETEETEKSESTESTKSDESSEENTDTDTENSTENDEDSEEEVAPTHEEIEKAIDDMDPIDQAVVRDLQMQASFSNLAGRLDEQSEESKVLKQEMAQMKKTAVNGSNRQEEMLKSETEIPENPNEIFGGTGWPFA